MSVNFNDPSVRSYLKGIGVLNQNAPTPPTNLAVSPDLASAVKKELGDSVVLGFDSEKVDTLKRFYFGGEEFVDFNASKSLGDNWKEVDSDGRFETKEFQLQLDPNGDSQSLTFNTADDSIRLSTRNSEPGPFEGTTDIENLWLTADGIVKRERATAI